MVDRESDVETELEEATLASFVYLQKQEPKDQNLSLWKLNVKSA